MEKSDLIITALQQRIGELVSNYETQIAILRAEITSLIDENNKREEALDSYSKEISAKIGLEE
jgi:hypothetical protein